jgi:hypothetical protein
MKMIRQFAGILISAVLMLFLLPSFGAAFTLTNAFLSVSPSTVSREPAAGVLFKCRVFNGASIYNQGPGTYNASVFDSGTNDISSLFNISIPTYNDGDSAWEFTVSPTYSVTVASNYFVGFSKDVVSDGGTLAMNYSTFNLGNGGYFGVTYAPLTLTYDSNVNPLVTRGCVQSPSSEIQYIYQVKYPDNNLESYAMAEYTIQVISPSGVDVTSNFAVNVPGYIPTYNYLYIQPKPSAAVGSGYRVAISKISNDTLAALWSDASSVSGGLAASGTFAVTNAALSIAFSNRTAASIGRGSATGTVYSWETFYPDGVTQEISDASSYVLTVLNKLGVDVTSNFSLSAVTYSNGFWWSQVTAKSAAASDTNYLLVVQKNPGVSGDAAPSRTAAQDLGSSGEFAVTSSALSAVFASISRTTVPRSDGIGTVYIWNVYYPDGVTQETNDTGYVLSLLNLNAVDVTTNFLCSVPAYSNGKWSARIIPLEAAVTNGYQMSLSKTPGGKGDTLAATLSGYVFAVTNSPLSVTFLSRNPASVGRADSAGVNWYYQVFYPDGVTQETNDTGYRFRLLDPSGTDASASFNFASTNYSANSWNLDVLVKSTATNGSGYRLEVSKLPGGSGDTLASNQSTNGLGPVNGVFCITNTNLNAGFIALSRNTITQADGTGTLVTWNVAYPDGVTMETDGNYFLKVYNSSGADVTSNFNVASPTYTGGRWQSQVIALPSAAAAPGFKVGVSRTNGDTLAEVRSDSVLGSAGQFAVADAALSVSFVSRNPSFASRGSTNGVTYSFRLYFPDGTTMLTNDAGSQTVLVYDTGVNVTTDFIVAAPLWVPGSGVWQTTVLATPAAALSANCTVSVSKSAGTSGETLAEKAATVDLASDGYFTVSNAALSLVYNQRDRSSAQRADGLGVVYRYQVFYANSTQETNGTGYAAKVYDLNSVDRSSEFSLSPFAYSNNYWYLRVIPYTSAAATNGYMLAVSKSGGDGDLIETVSTDGLGVNGTFAVSNAALSVTFLTNLATNIVRADSNGATYRYQVFYPDGLTQETGDSGYILRVSNTTLGDQTSVFNVGTPVYGSGYWQVSVKATVTTAVAQGYSVSVRKTAGSTGDILAEKYSTVDLPVIGGFSATNAQLTLLYTNSTATQLARTDPNGLCYRFRAYYPDGVTQETNQTVYSLKVFRNDGTDVSYDYTLPVPVYSNGFWYAQVVGHSNTAAGNGFYVGVTKTGGDYAPQKLSTNDLGGTNGCFDVANLYTTYLSDSNTSVQRGSTNTICFTYQVFNDVNVQLTNGGGYFVRVFDPSLNDVSTNFLITIPVYQVNCWVVYITALTNASFQPGYTIAVCKTNSGGDGLVMKQKYADDTTGDGGLGSGGVFTVLPAVLHMQTVAESPPSFQRVDGKGVLYEYTIYYPDNATQETSDYGYHFTVYNSSGIDVTSNFLLMNSNYTSGFWWLNVKATPTTVPGNGYYLGVQKLAGGKGDTMPLTNTLPSATFNISSANLFAVFSNRWPASFNRTDGIGTTYHYQVFFPDSNTQKTGGDGWQYRVYDTASNNCTSLFTIGTPVYSNNEWSINLQATAQPAVPQEYTNYSISVTKVAGTDPDTMPETISTNSNLNFNTGTFSVANLVPTWLSLSTNASSRADGVGVTFNVRITKPDGSYESTDASGFSVNVYNGTHVDVTSNFLVMTPVWNTDHWQFTVKPTAQASVGTNYHIRIEKTNALVADDLFRTVSTNLPGWTGYFQVNPASLAITYSNRTAAAMQRADGVGTRYYYNVYYGDGVTQETNDTAGYVVKVRNSGGTDVSPQFSISVPIFASGVWSTMVKAYNTTPPATGYMIGVSKTNAATPDTLAEAASTNNLGVVNGVFAVIPATLSLTFSNRVNPAQEQGSATDSTFSYKVFYEDGVTQETNDTAGYVLKVYSADGADATSTFNVSSPVYVSGAWNAGILTKYNTLVSNGYYFGVSKTNAAQPDTLVEKESTADLGLVNGTVNVTYATLNAVFSNRSAAAVSRGSTNGTTYAYKIFYDNMTDQMTSDTASFTLDVTSNYAAKFTTNFVISGPVYSNNSWWATIFASNSAQPGTGYSLAVAKTAGTTGETLATAWSTNNLGTSSGNFAVTYNTTGMKATFLSNSQNAFARADGIGTTYNFLVNYPDGSQLTNGVILTNVRNQAGSSTVGQYRITVPAYSNGSWQANVQSLNTTVVGYSNALGVSSTTGDTFDERMANADLGTAGYFHVSNASLNVTFLSNSRTNIRQADGIGVFYWYRVFYGDGVTQETNDTGYSFRVYDINGVDQTSNFTFSGPAYSGGAWEIAAISGLNSYPTNGYCLSVRKSPGNTGDTLPEKKSTGDLGANGQFSVGNEPSLTIVYLDRTGPAWNRTDPAGSCYQYRVFYEDGVTQETIDSNSYVARVYNLSTNEVTSQFVLGNPFYSNGCWSLNISGNSNSPVGTNFFISISKNPGISGDTLAAEYSTVGLSNQGLFSVADLRMTWQWRSNSLIQRADSNAVEYAFKVYQDNSGTEVTDNLTGFSVSAFDTNSNNISSRFTVSNIGYSPASDVWTFSLYSGTNTPAGTNYYVTLGQGFAGGHLLLPRDSRTDLGITNGSFAVSQAALNILFTSRDVPSFQILDGAGVNYRYQVTYNNGCQETSDTGYQFHVFNKMNADLTALFAVSNKGYDGTNWVLNVQSTAGTTNDTNYTIAVSKLAGTTGDTAAEKWATNDLGTNGFFEVKYANLSIVYYSRSTNQFQRSDGVGTTFFYRVFYPDLKTQETSDWKYYVFDILDASTNGLYDWGFYSYSNIPPVYNTNLSMWQIQLKSYATMPPVTNLYLRVTKPTGGNSRATLYASPQTPRISTDDLGPSNGTFAVTYASLICNFSNRSVPSIRRGATNGTSYLWTVYYDDVLNSASPTPENSDTNYQTRIYDSNGNDVTTNFVFSNPTNSSPSLLAWTNCILAKETAVPMQGYTMSVTKSSSGGIKGDYMPERKATAGDIVPVSNAQFQVLPVQLNCVFTYRTTNGMTRASGLGSIFSFTLKYDNGDQLTNDTGFTVRAYNSAGVDVSSNFNLTAPVYSNSAWNTEVSALSSAAAASNFVLSVTKSAGLSGDTVAETFSTNGLPGAAGVYNVYAEPSLHLTFESISTNRIQRADLGVTYNYCVFYEDGVSQETNDTGYVVRVFDRNTNLVGSSTNTGLPFTVGPTVYNASNWTVNVRATPAAATNTGYFIGVSKLSGTRGDTLAEKFATADLGLTNGAFEVDAASLHLLFTSLSNNTIQRGTGQETAYTFRVYYGDMVTELTNAASDFRLKVADITNGDLTGLFNLGTPAWTPGLGWNVTINAFSNAIPNNSNYTLSVLKLPGASGDYLAEKYATNDLTGTNGFFTVSLPSLQMQFLSRNPPFVVRTNTNTVLYTWIVTNISSGIQETNGPGYIVRLYDVNSNVIARSDTGATSNFLVAAPVYVTNAWQGLVTVYPATPAATNFFLSVQRTGVPQALLEKIAPTDLGANGYFNVLDSHMNFVYTSRSNATLIWSGNGLVSYTFRVYYDFYDGVTNEVTNGGSNFQLGIKDGNGSNVTANFTVSIPVYTPGSGWTAFVEALPAAPVASNYQLSVRGSTNSDLSIVVARDAVQDLGNPAGIFSVRLATNGMRFISFSTNSLHESETNVIAFRIYLPNGTNLLTNGVTLSNIHVYDAAGTNRTTNYILTNLRQDGTNWYLTMIPLPGVPVGKSNTIGVSFTNTDFAMGERLAWQDLSANGYFEILGSTLVLEFVLVENQTRLPGESETVNLSLWYPGRQTQLTNGLDMNLLSILDQYGQPASQYFDNFALSYTNTNWSYTFTVRSDTKPMRNLSVSAGGVILGNTLPTDSTKNQLGTDKGVFHILGTNQSVYQNYPNPFDPTKQPTLINIDIPEGSSVSVKLRIFTLTGNLVRTLTQGQGISASYQVSWDGRNDAGTVVENGLYYAVVDVGAEHHVLKILVLKKK